MAIRCCSWEWSSRLGGLQGSEEPLASLAFSRRAESWLSGGTTPAGSPPAQPCPAAAGEDVLGKPHPSEGLHQQPGRSSRFHVLRDLTGDNVPPSAEQCQPLIGNTLPFPGFEAWVTTEKNTSFQPHL